MAVQNNLPQPGPPADLPLQELHLAQIAECEDDHCTGWHDGLPRPDAQELLLEADDLVAHYALDDIRDQIRQAALLIDDPENVDRVDGLTEAEVNALQGKSKERSCCCCPKCHFRRWTLPTYLCHVGGVLFSCAELFAMGKVTADEGEAAISPTRMAIWFAIKFIGFWIALPCNRYLGRRRTLWAAAAAMIPASYGANPDALPALQFLSMPLFAAAVGVFQCTVAPYLAELSPARHRGAVVSSWILNQSISLFFIGPLHAVCLLGIGIGTLLTTVCLLPVCWFSAESPYTSVANGHAREAYDTLCRSRKHTILAACDLYRMLSFARNEPLRKTPISAFIPSRASLRAAASLAVVVAAQIIPCALAVYMQLLRHFGFSLIAGLVLVALFGLGPIALPFMDSLRRRQLVLAAMLLTLLIVFLECLGLWLRSWVLVMCVHVLIQVPIGMQMLVPFVYAAEVFPLEFRDTGMAVGASMLLAGDMVSRGLIDWPMLAPAEGRSWVMFYSLPSLVCFGLGQCVATVAVYLVMRETAGVGLEDMRAVFEARTRDLVRYRVRVHLPYVFRRYVLWRDVQLCPFEMSPYGSREEVKPVQGEDAERLLGQPGIA